MEIAVAFGAFVFAAFLVESFVEYTFAKWFSGEVLRWIALAVGVLFSFGFNLDIFSILRELGLALYPIVPWVGMLATGLIIGRGSNFVNDLITRVRGSTSSSVETTPQ